MAVSISRLPGRECAICITLSGTRRIRGRVLPLAAMGILARGLAALLILVCILRCTIAVSAMLALAFVFRCRFGFVASGHVVPPGKIAAIAEATLTGKHTECSGCRRLHLAASLPPGRGRRLRRGAPHGDSFELEAQACLRTKPR